MGEPGVPPRLSTATKALSARRRRPLTQRLDAVLLIGAVVRDEELAVRAFEALVAVGAARQHLRLEGLLAVGADDLVRGLLLGGAGHPARIAL